MARGRFGFLLLTAAVLCAAGPVVVQAQPADLRVTKSGNNVVLTIAAGGVAPFNYYKATSPTLSLGGVILATGQGTTWTDVGAITDGKKLVFYQIGDANRPAIAITSPVSGSSTVSVRVVVSGTQTNAAQAYVNGLAATLGAGTFTSSSGGIPNVPLAEGLNRITASAFDAAGNVALAQADLTKLGNNANAPTIGIQLTPSSGTSPVVVYVPKPLITVNYSDPDGIDTTRVFIYINGALKVPNTLTGAQATFQLVDPLGLGMNFIAVSVADNKGAAFRASTLTLPFVVRGPLITSIGISPVFGKPGDSITITGSGFSAIPTENQITVGGVSIPPAYIGTPAYGSLTFTIPPGLQTGAVKVNVATRDSNDDLQLTVILASGRTNIGGLAVDNGGVLGGNDLPVFFTERAATAQLYQCQKDGTWLSRGVTWASPTGLTLDQDNNLYIGEGATGGSGRVMKYVPGIGLSTYLTSSKLVGETSSALFGLAATGPGTGPTLYLLDNDNLKVKKVLPTLAVSAINTSSGTLNNPDAALLNSGGTSLYFSRSNSVSKIDLATPATFADFKTFYGGPRAMALTDDEKLIVPRVSTTLRQVSVVDPANPAGCSGTCYSYNLTPVATTGNFPILAAFGKEPGVNGKGYIVVADGATATAATRIYRLPKPSLAITQATAGTPAFPDGFTIYADWDPTVGTGVEAPDSQFVLLRVVTNPATLFPNGATGTYPAVVEWHFEDPPDPTSSYPNSNSWDAYNANNPWQQEGSYTMTQPGNGNCTTAVINGESRVRFHCTDRPGDNYIIKVRAQIPGFGTPALADPLWGEPGNGWIQTASPIFTVWKRLHAEVDSFGAAGPVNPQVHPDEASFEDVPDPTSDGACNPTSGTNPCLDPLRSILAPAFIEVIYDATNSKGDIPFNPFLDAAIKVVNGTGPDDTQLIAERNALAGSTSNTGYWGVYLLGAYNVEDGKYLDGVTYRGFSDNDPDLETIPGTTSTSYPMGMTATHLGTTQPTISAIFTEGIRDLAAQNGFNFYYALNVTAWHEACHQLHLPDYGTTDGSSGLMESAAPEKNMCLPFGDLWIIRNISFPSSTN